MLLGLYAEVEDYVVRGPEIAYALRTVPCSHAKCGPVTSRRFIQRLPYQKGMETATKIEYLVEDNKTKAMDTEINDGEVSNNNYWMIGVRNEPENRGIFQASPQDLRDFLKIQRIMRFAH